MSRLWNKFRWQIKIKSTRALGIKWMVKDDIFCFHFKDHEFSKLTRRIIGLLSFRDSVLGMISPWVVTGKIIQQQITSSQLGWDDTVSNVIYQKTASSCLVRVIGRVFRALAYINLLTLKGCPDLPPGGVSVSDMSSINIQQTIYYDSKQIRKYSETHES